MKPRISMRAALEDSELLGAIMSGASWLPWRTVLIAAMGEALNDDERVIFKQLTGRDTEPLELVEEILALIGRRGGKNRAAAVLATYASAFCDWSDKLAIGERGVVLVLAQNQKQAAVAFSYITGIFHAVPALAAMITNETSETISLTNGIDIEVRAANFRGLRGVTAVMVLADEVAFWANDNSVNPDTEILNAVRPALATTGGPLVMITSPHARRGEAWNTHRRHYGPGGDPRILVLQGASTTMNPTLPQSVVDRAIERDPAAASAEYMAQFRVDLEPYVSREVAQAAVDPGVFERSPIEAVCYHGSVDPSGGSMDSMTAAVSHLEGRVMVLDAVREFKPPFSPEAVVSEISDLLKRYRLSEVTGDRYAGEWPREAFTRHKITYRLSERTCSEIYQALLPELNSGNIALLDNQRLLTQLVSLERRTSRGGRDQIGHPPGQHDDLINAAGMALLLAKPRPAFEIPQLGVVQVAAGPNPYRAEYEDFGYADNPYGVSSAGLS
jgi:hypothetical protein